uniref:Uncharacterized protein n=1 Tax=viral metagenome TaxID=1070528 RepID=A0A6C0HYI0_9ZZZZ
MIDPQWFIGFIGFIHLIFIAYEILYPLIFKNYLFDKIYILIFSFKIISWILFNNECFISLIIKQQTIKNYKAGDNIFDLDDMVKFSPQLTKICKLLSPLLAIFYCYLIFIVSKRSKLLDTNLLITLITIYIIYLLYVRKFYNEKMYNKLNIDYFAPYVKSIFIVILSYIIYKIIKL